MENNLPTTTTQDHIVNVCEGIKDLLLYKNKKYGDAALNPRKIFYKGNSTNSILIRLNDKIARIENNNEEIPRINDIADTIGYSVLLLVSLGITKEDLKQFMD